MWSITVGTVLVPIPGIPGRSMWLTIYQVRSEAVPCNPSVKLMMASMK